MKFNVGDAVLFPNVYGETYSEKYSYRYGNVMAGFVTEIEYIEARKLYLYTIGTINPMDNTKVVYRTLGEHRLYAIDDYENCFAEVKRLAQKVEN